MAISIKTLEKYKLIYEKLLTYPQDKLPTWIGNLAEFTNTSISQVKKIIEKYDLILKFLGTEDQIKELRHAHQSEVAKIREASYSEEFKEKRKKRLSEKGKEQYERLTEEEKLNYRNNTFHKNWIPEKELVRRAKIKQTENYRSSEEINIIVNKRKANFEKKSEEELNDIYTRQGQSLKNTLSKLTEEQKLLRNKKTGEGRRLAYEKESPEHRQLTKNKISETCLEKYGVPWYTLSPKMKNAGRMYSKINQDIAKKLEELNIPFVQEFGLDKYSYDFKIDKYLIEINPSATHNVDWSPFGKENYLNDILNNSLYLEKLKDLNSNIYYYDLSQQKLVSIEEYKNCNNKKVVKIIGDDYKICKHVE